MAPQGCVGRVPHCAGNWLSCTGLGKQWTRVLLRMVVLLVCLYTALLLFAVTPFGPGAFGVHKPRQRRDIPQPVTSRTTTSRTPLAPRLDSGAKNRSMFDYSFENGTLAARAFPMSKNRITAVLLLPLKAQSAKPPSSCRYRGTAALSIRFLTSNGDLHDAKSVPVTVQCTFASDVVVSGNLSDIMEITGLGMDGSAIRRVPVVDYRQVVPEPFHWTVCTPSLHGSPRYTWIDQWLYYYTDKLKVDHVFIYSALAGQTLAVLNDSGVRHGVERVSLVNVFSQLAFHPYYYGQVFSIHDCLILNRHLGTKWVLFQDSDEVLTIPSSFPTPFDYFLQSSQNGVTALTFGNWLSHANKCLPETSVQAKEKGWPWIARMVPYSSPYCSYLCPDWQGRRKYVLQPDKHDMLYIHSPLGGNVRHVDVSFGYMRHFRGAADCGGLPICHESVPSNSGGLATQTEEHHPAPG